MFVAIFQLSWNWMETLTYHPYLNLHLYPRWQQTSWLMPSVDRNTEVAVLLIFFLINLMQITVLSLKPCNPRGLLVLFGQPYLPVLEQMITVTRLHIMQLTRNNFRHWLQSYPGPHVEHIVTVKMLCFTVRLWYNP